MTARIYHVLIIEDQPGSVESFQRRFENHSIDLDGTCYSVAYHFLRVKLVPDTSVGAGKWTISPETLTELGDFYERIPFDLVMIDYAFVPPERDEELTYKLRNNEIKTKGELLGTYILDAFELYRLAFQHHPSVKRRATKARIRYIIYTYPADSLMRLLGDANQRRNKLSRVLSTRLEVLDTRQLLYGGDKELERQHNRQLYPQLLAGHLNTVVRTCMQSAIIERLPEFKRVKLQRSVLAVTAIAGFAGGVGFLAHVLGSAMAENWNAHRMLCLVLLCLLIGFVFAGGVFLAVFFERLIRNLVMWIDKDEM